MAIDSYSTLVSTVTEYLGRETDTTLAGRVPDLIMLAEKKFNRTLFIPQMEKRKHTTVDTGSTEPEFITLPDDFQTMRRIRLSSVSGKPSLEFLSGTQIDDVRYMLENSVDQPTHYTIMGSELELLPTPGVAYVIEMVYRANVPALTATNTTNWLLDLAPDLYLYGTLLESAPYLQFDERINVWGTAVQVVLDQINLLGHRQSFDNGPSQVVLPGPTP